MKRSSSSVVDEALSPAVEEGSLRDVQVLVDQGADIHAHFYHNIQVHGTVMHVAAYYGHQHLLAFFLNKGLDVNTTNANYSQTPLHLASQAGHAEAVQFLLDQHANMHAVDSLGQKPIHAAVEAGQKDVVQLFLKKGMDVQEADEVGSTLLHLSSEYGKLEVAQLLVSYKADIHAKDADGRQPVHVAAEYGYQNIVQFFLKRGMSVDEPDDDGCTLLHWACRSCGLRFVEFLVANNADIHAKDKDGQKLIHVAAFWGQKDVVEYFLNLGMSVDETDQNGQTALHLAAIMPNLQVVQLLVDRIGAKSELDTQDNKGKTPMHLCYDKPDILNCLLDAGARSDIKDHDGRTVVFYYIDDYKRHRFYYPQSVVAKMRHNFVDIDDETKMTAAHLVKDYHDMDLIKFVLQHQKDLNIENKSGETPMNYLTGDLLSSSDIGRRETLIRMFVDHGAYFKAEDCERIVQNRTLKKKLFTDKKFCSQYLVNKFDNVDLPMLAWLPSAISPSVLERLKLKNSHICQIERAVEEEIRSKGHCDVSKMAPPLLSMLAIESYVSHYCTS